MKTRILIVENDAVTALDIEGLFIEAAASANEALKMAQRIPPDLVRLDIGPAGSVDGIELARRLRERFSLAHIYVAGHIEPAVLVRANHTNPLGYIVKPFKDAELLIGIENALSGNGQRCRTAINWGAPAPFVVDRSLPIRIAGDVCPMELRCSSHLAAAGWSDGDSLAAPGTTAPSGTASWRPE